MLKRIQISLSTLLALMMTSTFSSAQESQATYQLEVINTWTPDQYPIGYPSDAHFSWIGGGAHDSSLSYWDLGGIPSLAIERMAESGSTSLLINEIFADGGQFLQWQQWFCRTGFPNENCGPTIVQFVMTSELPALTLTSMVAPSPDWFIGISGMKMYQGDHWLNHVVIPLAIYDAGTEEGLTPVLSNPPTEPFDAVSLASYDPQNGNYNRGNTVDIVGEFVLTLVSVEGDLDNDEDAITNSFDNCIDLENPNQSDPDNDGFGTPCDADFNNDCMVNMMDLVGFKQAFLSVSAEHDLNGDGVVNFIDFSRFAELFLEPPGPSALSSCEATELP